MATNEPLATEFGEYSEEYSEEATTQSNSTETSNNTELSAEEKERRTEEYLNGLIEGRKKRNAFNNKSVRATLAAAIEWDKKHFGKTFDESGTES